MPTVRLEMVVGELVRELLVAEILIPWGSSEQCECRKPFPDNHNPDRKAVATTKRRIEITVEKHRLIVLSQRNHSVQTWCEACGEQVQMVTPDEAAQLSHASTRTIYRRVETGRLHLKETEKGFSLICLRSLAK